VVNAQEDIGMSTNTPIAQLARADSQLEVHLSQCIIEKLMKLQKFKTDGLAYLGRQLLWQEQIIAANKGEAHGMAKLQNEMPKNS